MGGGQRQVQRIKNSTWNAVGFWEIGDDIWMFTLYTLTCILEDKVNQIVDSKILIMSSQLLDNEISHCFFSITINATDH